MDWKNLNPWDWFKHEDKTTSDKATIPVKHNEQQAGNVNELQPMAQFHQEIDRLFDETFRQFGMPSLRSRLFEPGSLWDSQFDFRPSLNVSSNENQYIVSVEAPGMDEKDLSIELNKDVLTIKGNKQEEKEEKEGHFYRSERRYGSFQRVLSIPKDAQPDGIDAKIKNGVLTIQIPRKEQDKSEVKHIAIEN